MLISARRGFPCIHIVCTLMKWTSSNPSCASKLKEEGGKTEAKGPVGTVCLYFWTEAKPPSEEPILYLNGSGAGFVNNCCFPSTVSGTYAPDGKTLVSVSLVGCDEYGELGEEALAEKVKEELGCWFGAPFVGTWEFLRLYRIPFAQPNQERLGEKKRANLEGGIWVCGDWVESATLDGALRSGQRVGMEIATKLAITSSV